LRLLENVAISKFNAKTLTLDTQAYEAMPTADGKSLLDNMEKPGRSIAWYEKMGYEVFRVSIAIVTSLIFAIFSLPRLPIFTYLVAFGVD
jgi:hypothetical protein